MAEVLLLVLDLEAGAEVAVEHLRREVLRAARGARACADGFEHRARVDAGLHAEDERFADGEVGDGDGDLVAELDDLAAAAGTAVDEGLADGLEDRAARTRRPRACRRP